MQRHMTQPQCKVSETLLEIYGPFCTYLDSIKKPNDAKVLLCGNMGDWGAAGAAACSKYT